MVTSESTNNHPQTHVRGGASSVSTPANSSKNPETSTNASTIGGFHQRSGQQMHETSSPGERRESLKSTGQHHRAGDTLGHMSHSIKETLERTFGGNSAGRETGAGDVRKGKQSATGSMMKMGQEAEAKVTDTAESMKDNISGMASGMGKMGQMGQMGKGTKGKSHERSMHFLSDYEVEMGEDAVSHREADQFFGEQMGIGQGMRNA